METIDRLLKLFSDELHVDVPDAETNLLEQGLLDSLRFVDLLVQLEQHFGCEVAIDEIEFDQFQTVRSIAEFVSKHVDGQKSDEQPAIGAV